MVHSYHKPAYHRQRYLFFIAKVFNNCHFILNVPCKNKIIYVLLPKFELKVLNIVQVEAKTNNSDRHTLVGPLKKAHRWPNTPIKSPSRNRQHLASDGRFRGLMGIRKHFSVVLHSTPPSGFSGVLRIPM